mgnify:CR=1 FL=1
MEREDYALKYMNFKDEVGAEIRRRRTKLGMTGEELGDKVGVSYHHILGIERGERKPSLKTLYLIITQGLEISVDTFFRGLE